MEQQCQSHKLKTLLQQVMFKGMNETGFMQQNCWVHQDKGFEQVTLKSSFPKKVELLKDLNFCLEMTKLSHLIII